MNSAATAVAMTLPRPPSSEVPPRTTAATEGSRYESPWKTLGLCTIPASRMPAVQYEAAATT